MLCSRYRLHSKIFKLYNHRYKSEVNQFKSELGDTIRRVNRENKQLFGKLLETKSEKRKRKHGNSGLNMLRGNLISDGRPDKSELHWSMKTAPNSISIIKKNNANNPKENRNSSHLTSVSDSANITNLNYNGNCREKSSCETSNLQPAIANRTSDIVHENMDPFQRNQTSSCILPEIIVRNITSFPLLNDKKEVSDNDGLSQNVISHPRTNIIENNPKFRDLRQFPSVSKILNTTMSESSVAALERWREKLISELGEEGFKKYYEDQLAHGSQFHNLIQNYLGGMPKSDLIIDPAVEGSWESVISVLKNIHNIKVLESHVFHSMLRYQGVIDCVAEYEDKLVLIEWKKSRKGKEEISKTYDAPLQLSAYVGAMNYDTRYNLQVNGGLIVVAFTDGMPAKVFNLSQNDCHKYWRQWLLRLQKYWLSQTSWQENG